MQLKIITHIIVFSCYLTSVIGRAICPGGCYECEEEVWEEVPCDHIPLNITTISPPLPYYYTTPSYTKPSYTTTSRPETTTIIPTTITVTPSTIPTTIHTTIPTTIPITIPTTTTTTKPKYDSFKKCYCECKIGCKEFCRKVVINSDPKKQIVQFSKITEPVAQGQIESTHYHQRELKANTTRNKNYRTFGNDSVSQPPIKDNNHSKAYTSFNKNYRTSSNDFVSEPLTNNNNYSNTESNKYQASIPTPPLNHYEENHSIVNNENSVLVQPIPYAPTEADFKNINSYSSSQIPHNQPSIDYTSPNLAPYDFSIPFGNIYSKISKTIVGPTDSGEMSIAPSNPSYSNRPCSGFLQPTFLSPTPVKSSQLETPVSFSKTLIYDDSFDAIIKEFMSHNPANGVSYETYSRPFYSLSYKS